MFRASHDPALEYANEEVVQRVTEGFIMPRESIIMSNSPGECSLCLIYRSLDWPAGLAMSTRLQLTGYVNTMLVQCWTSVKNVGPTLNRQWPTSRICCAMPAGSQTKLTFLFLSSRGLTDKK